MNLLFIVLKTYVGMEREGVGPGFPGGLRGHRRQHVDDAGQAVVQYLCHLIRGRGEAGAFAWVSFVAAC